MREKDMNEWNRLDARITAAKRSLMEFSPKAVRLALIAGATLAVGCSVFPIHNRVYQAGLFVGVGLCGAGLWILMADRRLCKVMLLALPLVAALPFLLPDKPMDTGALRTDYISRLRGFDGTRYVWGGESPLGIDCSGLPRRAYRDALWSEGWRHANGTAFRMWLAQWCYDASALAMRDGYRGWTQRLGRSGPLWELDRDAGIHPGALAVRGDGGHVVAYLGDHQWIEADPNRGKVHIWTSTPGDGVWYEHMILCRWKAFGSGDT